MTKQTMKTIKSIYIKQPVNQVNLQNKIVSNFLIPNKIQFETSRKFY